MGAGQDNSRKLLVLVGPPGVGKKFCTLRLNGNHPMDMEIIKTLTTQPQRQIYDSLFYRTVSLPEFQEQAAAGGLLEHDEFAGHWYGIERGHVETILKQKHGIVSATPMGADTLRRSGFPTILAYLIPASKAFVEDNLVKKNEDPERLPMVRQDSSIFAGLPEPSFDIVVRVKSLADAVKELDEKLQAFVPLQ